MPVLRSPGDRTWQATSLGGRALAAASAVALLMSGTPQAAAAPDADLTTVKRKVETLGVKVSEHTEDYNEARIQLRAAEKRMSTVNRKMAGDERQVKTLRKSVGALAASVYMTGPADVASLTTAERPQDVVDRASSIEHVSTQRQAKIRAYERAAEQLGTRRATAAAAVKEQRRVTAKMKRKRDAITTTLAEQKRLLERLTAAGRDQRASRSERQPNVDLPPASGRARDAIAFAQRQLGKPYEWGAEGPDSYDCSGLTMQAWRRGGVSLPHSSDRKSVV